VNTKENKYITYNEMCPNCKIFVSGTYVFTSRHYYMHLTGVSITFIRLLDFLYNFVFLRFVVINRLRRGGGGFGLCDGLQTLHNVSLCCEHAHFNRLTLPELVSALYKSTR
jgi:hypothetical protein